MLIMEELRIKVRQKLLATEKSKYSFQRETWTTHPDK